MTNTFMTNPLRQLASLLLAGCATLASNAGQAQPGQDLTSLVIASKQSMLSERVLKSYAQGLLQIQPDKAASALQQAMAELHSNNATLKLSAPSAATTLLDQQSKLIDQLAGIVALPATADSLGKAFKVSEDLWANTESMTKSYHGTPPAALVSLASGQRMLTQRTAAMYFLQQTSLKSADVKRRLAEADDDFKSKTAAFDDHKGDFPGIATNLELAKLQMVFFDNAVHHLDAPTKEQMLSVATASERILSQMEELTRSVQARVTEQSQPTRALKK